MSEPIRTKVLGKAKKPLTNPFPGLRPFGVQESHLFFGREVQSDEVLLKLSNHRFVTVIGPSGSGKSSFIYCGVIPLLYGGFLTDVSAEWHVISARPGTTPIENLAEALLNSPATDQPVETEEKRVRKAILTASLQSSSLGLVEAVGQHEAAGKNFLILIDQFEELFRLKRNETHPESASEAAVFINLLVEAVRQQTLPIFVVATMRSDFIGECSQFSALTDLVNESYYLIPQMTREQKRMAITGPVTVGGARMTPRLVQQLLSDLGDNPDQLPILQHALMRTWDYWSVANETSEPIDLPHYEAIGRMQEALSQHADEAYEELTEPQKRICEVVFKSITERGNETNGVRRPTTLAEIAGIAGVSEEEITVIVEKFRQPGRALLIPFSGVPLSSDSVIDVSHESLMRIWVRLKKWVEEESESVQMYLRLSEAAANYQVGRASLWRPPDLQLALNWQFKQQPTLFWAQRYDPAFERAMVFLEFSKKTYETEQKTKEILQKRTLRRAQLVALILGLFTVFSGGFLIFAITQQFRAKEQAELAMSNERKAREQTQLALVSERNAKNQRSFAEQQRERAKEQERLARESEQVAQLERQNAQLSEKEARIQQQLAREQQALAQNNEQRALDQQQIAVRERNNAYNLRLLSIAQAMAVKSLQVTDSDLKALTAQQAYVFNSNNGGKNDDPYVYDGLYYAVKRMQGESFGQLKGHTDLVRALAATSNGNTIYSAGSDGRILRFNANQLDQGFAILTENKGVVNRTLALSHDNRWLACVGDMPYIQLFDLQNPISAQVIQTPTRHGWYVSFMPENQGMIFSDSITIYHYDQKDFTPVTSVSSKINAIAVNAQSGLIAVGSKNGQVALFRLNDAKSQTVLYENKLPITALTYSPDGRFLAAGDQSGTVFVWEVTKKKMVAILSGHAARVNNICFSPDGKKLATGSWDKTVRIWNVVHWGNQPIVLKDYNTDWVWSIAFSSDGEKLFAGCKDRLLRVWPTNAKVLADLICDKMKRNMTDKEWREYVADDITYERTCPELPAGEIENSDSKN